MSDKGGIYRETFTVEASGQGTVEITDRLREVVDASEITDGLVHVFVKHTSCSLVIMENADPSARRDLEAFMDRLVPEGADYFEHTTEGPDDMPSHIKMALTRTSETIPLADGRLVLGTWQGVFLWEHRRSRHRREVVVTVMGG